MKKLILRDPKSPEVRKAFEKMLSRDVSKDLNNVAKLSEKFSKPPRDYKDFQFQRFGK
jgi:hypothetical protein